LDGTAQAPDQPNPAERDDRQVWAEPSQDDWGRAFSQLCHLVALTRTGKVRSVVDNAVILAFVIEDRSVLTGAKAVTDVLSTVFGIHLSQPDVQQSIDRHVQSRVLVRDRASAGLSLAQKERADVKARISAATQLQADVREQWFAELQASDSFPDGVEPTALWDCLSDFLASMFRQHGVNTIQLLSHTADQHAPSLRWKAMARASIKAHGLVDASFTIEPLLLSFVEKASSDRARYLAQLLDGTFSFFALSIEASAAQYLAGHIPRLDLFLDTNVLFGLLELHDNPMTDASRELVEVIRREALPFTLYYHQRTLREMRTTIGFLGDRLTARRSWPSALSRAIVSAQILSGLERHFHALNAEQPIDPAAFMTRYENVDALLDGLGLKIYRPHVDHFTIETKGSLIADYAEFAKQQRPGHPERPYAMA